MLFERVICTDHEKQMFFTMNGRDLENKTGKIDQRMKKNKPVNFCRF